MEIRIGKSAHNCVACERVFVHDEELRSLVRLENRMLQREDYCVKCWNPGRGAGAFSIWSSRFYDPKVAAQQPPEVFSPLRQAFYESVESADRVELAKSYLAAQLLRRQKVFRLIKEANDPDADIQIALFSDRIGNALVEVRDPSLTYEEMEAGRLSLLDRLRELEAPPGSEPAEGGVGEESGNEVEVEQEGLIRTP
jgi:hypothetical protein